MVKVAVDLTPLLGARTGIGVVVAEVAGRLAERPDVDPTGLLISWRGRAEFASQLPQGWQGRRVGLPARACHRLWRHIDRPAVAGFDVVHGLNYVVPPAAGGAELVAVHDLTAWRYPDLVDAHSANNPRLLERAMARGAHVHTGSAFVADELINDLGLDPDRVHTLVNGPASALVGDLDRGRDLVGAHPFVLAVGTIEPRKDYVGLIEAMNQVWADHPDLRLVIVGRSGWGAENLDQAVAQCRHPDQVIRPGYTSDQDKADLLAAAQALVYPSLYEGFGFPLLEAMQAGVPVIATKAGSIPEVADGAALLVPPRQPDQLAAAIVELVTDRQRADGLISLGVARVRAFSWDTMVDGLVALYHRLGDHSGM